MKARKIVRRSLHEDILEQLTDMIVQGRWKPNEIIQEMDLCDELGVSRTPLRESMKILAAEGLLDIRARTGTHVKVLSPTETRELFETAGIVESAAAQLAVVRSSDKEIASIARLHREMIAAKTSGDRIAYFDFNQRIHKAIVGAAGNSVLENLHTRLLLRMRRIRFACTSEDSDWDAAIDEHEALLKALEERDPDGLAQMLQDHMQKGFERVESFVEAENADINVKKVKAVDR